MSTAKETPKASLHNKKIKRRVGYCGVFACIFMLPAFLVLAVDAPPAEAVAANAAFFSWVLGLALFCAVTVIGWYVKSGNENNDRQWRSIASLDRRLSYLEGEHNVNHLKRRKEDQM